MKAGNSVVGTNLALMIVAMLSTVITARYLGVAERGLYLTWSSWNAMVGTLAMLGTQSFIVVAAERVGTRVSTRTVLPLLGAGIGLAALGSWGAMVFLNAPRVVFIGGACHAISGPIVATLAAIQQANGDHGWRFNLARAVSPVTGFISVLGMMFWLRGSATVLYLALGGGCLVGSVIAVLICRQKLSSRPHLIGIILRLSLGGSPLVLLGWLMLNIDTLAVSMAGDSTDVGIYGIGVAARSAVTAVGTSVGLRWFARRGQFFSLGAVARQFIPVVIVAGLGAAFAPVLVPWILGAEFRPSVPCVVAQAVGGVLASVDFLLSHMILVRVSYLLPTILRGVLVVLILVGVFLVHGRPLASALVFSLAMFLSCVGQIALGAAAHSESRVN